MNEEERLKRLRQRLGEGSMCSKQHEGAGQDDRIMTLAALALALALGHSLACKCMAARG